MEYEPYIICEGEADELIESEQIIYYDGTDHKTDSCAYHVVVHENALPIGRDSFSDFLDNLNDYIGVLVWNNNSSMHAVEGWWAKVTYICAGLELAPSTERLHLDITLELDSAVPLGVIRELFRGCHVEIMLGDSTQCLSYTLGDADSCRGAKDHKKLLKARRTVGETPRADTFAEAGVHRYIENWAKRTGVIKEGKKQGERTDLLQVAQAIREGMPWDDLEVAYTKQMIMYRRALTDLFQREQQKRAKLQLAHQMGSAVLRPWQQECVSNLDSQSARQISWWHDRGLGNVGKSFLCQYLMHHKGYILLELGSKRDLAHALIATMESANHCVQGVLFDITRSVLDGTNNRVASIRSVCQLAESIKNGCIFSGKYNSRLFYISQESRRVGIFANFAPDEHEREELLSADRWDVHQILSL
jgi:hypothetical protein